MAVAAALADKGHSMNSFTLFLILFPVIFGLLMWLKHSSDRKYGTQAERAAELYGYTASVPEATRRPRAHESAIAHVITHASPPMRPVAPPVITSQPVRLSGREVWQKLQTAIHLLIVGETHSGKSTTAEAVLWGRVQSSDQIVILDPHASPHAWRGVPAIGGGRDYPAIESAMTSLIAEMTSRYQLLTKDLNYTSQPLTIFVDEWPAIQTNCPKTAASFMLSIAQEGRKVGMRLVILTQSNRVESLGLSGKGDARQNFTSLLLGSKALEECKDSAAFDRPAAMAVNGAMTPAAVEWVPDIAAKPMPYVVLWQVPADVQPASVDRVDNDIIAAGFDPDLYRRFVNKEDLLEPIGTSDGAVGGTENGQKSVVSPVMETAVLPDDTSKKPVIENLPTDEQSVAIRLLVNGGMSRNKTIQLLSLSGTRVEQLKRIKQALGETENSV